MPRTNRITRWPWLILFILIMMIGMSWLVRAQPPDWGQGGPGGGDDPGWSGGPGDGGPGGPAPPRFDPRLAITITGAIESLGSYGRTGWRVAPGLVAQGLVLKTVNGYKEIDLGPPGYVAEQRLQLKTGDTLEVVGFQADRHGKNIFMAASVKTPAQTLRLLDERGFPLWRARGPRGPGSGGMGGDGPPERGLGPDDMGPGSQGRGGF
jgi:hypothetical protein